MIPRISIRIELLDGDIPMGQPKKVLLEEIIETSTSVLELDDQEQNSYRLAEQMVYKVFREFGKVLESTKDK